MSTRKLINTEIGDIFIQVSAIGVQKIKFFDNQFDKKTINTPANSSSESILNSTVYQLKEYFSGNLEKFTIPFDLSGTEFQLKVWFALQTIPFGRTTTYGSIASQIGFPRASRAVGGALNKNPISIVLPCHRVIGANGSLTGFGSGMERKIWLLEHEYRKSNE
tara:strand:+ start:8872 stop:9360 length:489 start_codon:yes stop_codon:yes gene_type:complete